MPPLSNAELGAIASQLGHSQLELESFGKGTKKGVRWVLRCSCGWSSLNFVLVDAAVAAGKTHLRNVVARDQAQKVANGGRVLRGPVGARS